MTGGNWIIEKSVRSCKDKRNIWEEEITEYIFKKKNGLLIK